MDRKILITNDDGIDAEGIIKLARAATKFGEVWVVAPDGQRSAASHSITLRHPFIAKEVEFPVEGVHAYACSGMPGDCIRIGVLNIVPGKPDVILSGINFGYNLATDLQYSATAGAAFEGAFQGIHSIALSEGFGNHALTSAYLEQVIEELIDKKLGYGQIWNVNFPDGEPEDCKGILRDRIVSHESFYHDRYKEEALPDGGTSYMVYGILNEKAEENSDFRAVMDKYISIGIATNIS